MIAMAWPWGLRLPVVPQVALLSAGALWFIAAAPFGTEKASAGRAVLSALPHVPGEGNPGGLTGGSFVAAVSRRRWIRPGGGA